MKHKNGGEVIKIKGKAEQEAAESNAHRAARDARIQEMCKMIVKLFSDMDLVDSFVVMNFVQAAYLREAMKIQDAVSAKKSIIETPTA